MPELVIPITIAGLGGVCVCFMVWLSREHDYQQGVVKNYREMLDKVRDERNVLADKVYRLELNLSETRRDKEEWRKEALVRAKHLVAWLEGSEEESGEEAE